MLTAKLHYRLRKLAGSMESCTIRFAALPRHDWRHELDASLDDGGEDDDDYFNDGGDTQSISGGDAWLAGSGSFGGGGRAAGSTQHPGSSSDRLSSCTPSGDRTLTETRYGSNAAGPITLPPQANSLVSVSSQSSASSGWGTAVVVPRLLMPC